VKILKADEVRKICIEFEFNSEQIDEYLAVYDIEEKFKGIKAYEWNQTITQEEKNMIRRKKLMESKRKK
jgi:hypothetical protein